MNGTTKNWWNSTHDLQPFLKSPFPHAPSLPVRAQRRKIRRFVGAAGGGANCGMGWQRTMSTIKLGSQVETVTVKQPGVGMGVGWLDGYFWMDGIMVLYLGAVHHFAERFEKLNRGGTNRLLWIWIVKTSLSHEPWCDSKGECSCSQHLSTIHHPIRRTEGFDPN